MENMGDATVGRSGARQEVQERAAPSPERRAHRSDPESDEKLMRKQARLASGKKRD